MYVFKVSKMIILCILAMYQIQTQTRGGSTGKAWEQEPAGGHEWQMTNDDKHHWWMEITATGSSSSSSKAPGWTTVVPAAIATNANEGGGVWGLWTVPGGLNEHRWWVWNEHEWVWEECRGWGVGMDRCQGVWTNTGGGTNECSGQQWEQQ